jgi:hypothetical protein
MEDPFDPAVMTPEERTAEVASILATGYIRHRALQAPGPASLSPDASSDTPDADRAPSPRSPEKALDGPGDQAPPCDPGERA